MRPGTTYVSGRIAKPLPIQAENTTRLLMYSERYATDSVTAFHHNTLYL